MMLEMNHLYEKIVEKVLNASVLRPIPDFKSISEIIEKAQN